MKHLKLMMAALAIMMGLTMTSCFDEDDTYERTATAVAKLRNGYAGYEFVTSDGMLIIPSLSSINKFESNNNILLGTYLNDVCYLIYSIPEGTKITEETTSISDVALEGLATLNSKVEMVEEVGAANDSINKAAIISLGKENNSLLKPSMFDDNTVFLCIDYFILSKEHTFTLVDYVNEQPEENVLTLYLRHNDNGDSQQNTSTTAYYWANSGYVWFFYHTFDITRSLMNYQLKHGKKPEAINIVTYENAASSSLETAKRYDHYIRNEENQQPN